ncbi:hypothetical protein BGZ47_002788 [Haplosporangium gracile]|nr:hypothetical protein BGZ47_002788 [Haplosporangium gracile]
MNTIVSLGAQFEQEHQQPANSTSTLPPSDFSANSPTLFSFNTITSLLFYQPITRIVVVLTVLQSLLGLGGKFPEHCSAPSHVLYGGEYLELLISPFVVPLTPTLLKSAHQTLGIAVMLAISNLINFGLFEEGLTAVFRDNRTKRSNTSINHNSTRIFRNLVLIIVVLVMGLRQLLGFIFSRALGWAYPSLFFSDSVIECNLGLAPFLFALLVIQAFLPDDSDPRTSSTSSTALTTSTSIFAFRRIYVQIILCLFNVIPKAIFWWAGSGLIVGFVVSLGVAYQRRMGRWGGKVRITLYEKHSQDKDVAQEQQLWQDQDALVGLGITDGQDFSMTSMASNNSKETSDDSDSDSNARMSLESTAASSPVLPTTNFSAVPGYMKERTTSYIVRRLGGYVLPMIAILFFILVATRQLHNYKPNVSDDVLNSSIEPTTPFLLTLVMMTAPRRDGMAFIKQTLSSYLDAFPDVDQPAHPLYSRIQVVVYTHVTDHPRFDEARTFFETNPKARKHIKWIREDGAEKSQRKHLISAIRKIGTSEDSVYLGIMEDDFPFCEGGFQTMLNTIYEADRQVKDHCGVFITTGGSGLIFKKSVALVVSFVLEQDELAKQRGMAVPAPDQALQNCMLGQHDYCSSCAGTMVISKTLLQRHLGHNASTSGGVYSPEAYQCGWRHPFHGDPNIHVL